MIHPSYACGGQTPEELLEQFRHPRAEAGLVACYTPTALSVGEEEIRAFAAQCVEAGVGCILPRLMPLVDPKPQSETLGVGRSEADAWLERQRAKEQDERLLACYRRVYTVLCEALEGSEVRLALHVELPLEHMVVREAAGRGMRGRMLVCREYYLNQQQNVRVLLSDKGRRLSLMAVDLWDGEMVDLRDCVEQEHLLVWDVPTGNWCVREYLCCADPQPNANYLSYVASRACIDTVLKHFSDILERYPDRFSTLYMGDICFRAPNCRSWTPEFNTTYAEVFEEDPAPRYPYLYDVEDAATPLAKARLFSCRAEMLQRGLLDALRDVAQQHQWRLIAELREPRSAAPSLLSGDTVGNGSVSATAKLDRAYLYGINSLRLAAAGSYNYGGDLVSCRLCCDYAGDPPPDAALRDVIHAMGHGANLILSQIGAPDGTDATEAFRQLRLQAGMVRRCAALLQGGGHVSDIAVLYPIDSIHSAVSFYEARVRGEELPDTPQDSDYLTLINALTLYGGRDVTLLHPEVMERFCYVENGRLVLKREDGSTDHFRVLVLPSTRLLRPACARMLQEFYACGGRLIATGERLPARAYLTDANVDAAAEDAGVRAQMRAIFGEVAGDTSVVAGQMHAQNDRGGEAYWLYPGSTAADGSMMVDSAALCRVLHSFSLPPDVEFPARPRLPATGAMNVNYPTYLALGLDRLIPGGGVFSHIHKSCGESEVYFFGNSTDREISGEVFLRGEHRELWRCDPFTGEACRLVGDFPVRHGRIYTRIRLSLPAVSCCLVVGK